MINKLNNMISRRAFLAGSVVTGAAVFSSNLNSSQKKKAEDKRFKLVGFSKPFRDLSFEDTADVVAEIGWDGIECPVRSKSSQILPENVEDQLPKLAEALKKRRKEIAIVTTDIRTISNPLTEKVLRTISNLGIKRYRLDFWFYEKDKSIQKKLNEIRAELRDLVALNKELGLQAGIQNHSGTRIVGAPIWDIYELVKGFDPKYMGIIFDIGHAIIEGGYAWPINARLMEPYYTAISAKDFVWKKTEKGWYASWLPLGKGMVRKEFFELLKKSSFSGPITQHHEYPVGKGKEMIVAMQKDLEVLRKWLSV